MKQQVQSTQGQKAPYSQEPGGCGWAVESEHRQLQEIEGGRALGDSSRLSASCEGQERFCSTADWKMEERGCSQASLGLGPSGPLWPFLWFSPWACTCLWGKNLGPVKDPGLPRAGLCGELGQRAAAP